MKKYKYITISLYLQNTSSTSGKPDYKVNENKHGEMLAMLQWNKRWKCYELCEFMFEVAFTSDCLRDIIDFIENYAGKREAGNE